MWSTHQVPLHGLRKKIDGTVFCNDSPGFSVLTAGKENLKLNLLDKEGKTIHVVSRSK